MKTRFCFVSNSSSSSFIIDAYSIEEAKERLAESIAVFLDHKSTHERHLQEAREFIEDRLKLDKIAFFKYDDIVAFNKLQKLLYTVEPEKVLNEADKGKIVMVDYDRDSVVSEYAEFDTWSKDEEAIAKIRSENGIEAR